MKIKFLKILIYILVISFAFIPEAYAATSSMAVRVTIEQIVAGVVSAPLGQSGNPGALLVYTFTIQNTGNAPDTFNLTAKSSERWPENLPGGNTTGVLTAGEVQAINVELAIPSDEIVSTVDALTLTATSQTNRKISGEDSVLTTVNQIAGALVTAPRGKAGRAGQTITYSFTVENIGNGPDAFNLEAASSQGWLVNLPDGNTTGTLQPAKTKKSSTKVKVEVAIPSDATSGTVDELTLMATSQFDLLISDSGSSNIVVR